MSFDIVGEISGVEVIAKGPSLRVRAELNERYGTGRWRKLKGTATVRLPDGSVAMAAVHWKRFKIKRFVE